MKKILVSLVAMMFLFAPMAFGLTIYGGLDEYLPPPKQPPVGDEQVLNWVNNTFSLSYTLDNMTKYDGLTINRLTKVTVDNIDYYVFDFGDVRPDYFFFKQARDGYFHKNNDLLQYGVVRFGVNFINAEVGVSNIIAFGGKPVPEPATLLLFGAGIAGLALYRRKRS